MDHPPAITEDDEDARPGWACCLHRPPDEGYPWKPADDGYATCSACLDKLRGLMWGRDERAGGTAKVAGIAVLYARLDATPGRGGDGSRGAPGFGSRSPASDHVIAFRDPRSSQTARTWRDRAGRICCEDERPPVSVRGELDIIAWDVAGQLGHDGPDDRADVDDLLRFIDRKLDAVTRVADLTEQVASSLRALRTAMRPAAGEPRPRYIGHCPAPVACTEAELPDWSTRSLAAVAPMLAWCAALLRTRDPGWLDDVLSVLDAIVDPGCEPALLDDDGNPARRCGVRLFAPLRSDRVVCRSCDARWERADWWTLGEALAVAG